MWISAVVFILFIYFELTVKHPLIELRIFKDRNFSLANVMMFIFGIGMFGSTFLIPLYLQNNLGYTALQAGMFFIPVGIIQGFCSPTAGALGQKINPKILIAGGLILMAMSFYLNYFLSFLTEEWYIMTSLCPAHSRRHHRNRPHACRAAHHQTPRTGSLHRRHQRRFLHRLHHHPPLPITGFLAPEGEKNEMS